MPVVPDLYLTNVWSRVLFLQFTKRWTCALIYDWRVDLPKERPTP